MTFVLALAPGFSNIPRRMAASAPLILGVLVSGSGSNLQAVIDACAAKRIRAQVGCVVSDTPGVRALERAAQHGIPAIVIGRKGFASKAAFEEAIVAELRSHGVSLVCLAGFMRIIGATLLGAFPERVINIHPALLPAFPGLEGQRQAFDYGVKIAGCTVHFVDEQTDHGPIIRQAAVAVKDDDTIDALKARILDEEHRIYPEAIGLIADGRVTIDGRKVRIKGE